MSRRLGLALGLVLALAASAAAEGPGFALRCFGTGSGDIDRIKVLLDVVGESTTPTTPANIGATDFTVEFWVRPLGTNNGAVTPGASNDWIRGNIIVDRDRFNTDRAWGISLGSGRVCFGVDGPGGVFRTICGTTDIRDGTWRHVAVTRAIADGVMAVYVHGTREAVTSAADGPDGDISYPIDGVPCSTCCTNAPSPPSCNFSDPYMVVCAEKHDAGSEFPSFSGQIDELHLSRALRYTGTSYTVPTAPFIPDASTAALYHFDEGTGTVARDVMDARNNGDIRVGGGNNGPQWVTSTAPLGGQEGLGRTIQRRLYQTP